VGGDPVLAVGAGVLGLCFGSFLNVCILRLWHEDRKQRSLIHPPSTCPHCKQPIAADDNFCMHCGVQLVSHVRRCNKCGAYPDPRDRYCILCGEELRTPAMA